jgi:hypothetical protein
VKPARIVLARGDFGLFVRPKHWGKPMLLDTSHAAAAADQERSRLSKLRAALIAEYPQVGPILA